MKAILARDGAARLCEVPVPEVGDGELLLALEACGLCGTDLMKLATRARGAVLGHELVGRVAKAGPGAPFREGERLVVSHHVPCLGCHYCRKGQEPQCRGFKATNIDPGGFSEFVRVPAAHARHTAFRLPEGLSAAAASQTEPLACVLRNLRRLGAGPGDAVGVVGLGAVGQTTGQALRLLGAEALGLDLDPARAALFSRWGMAFAGAEEFAQAARAAGGGRGLDAVVFSAGGPELVARAASWLRDGGTLNVFASFHPDPFLRLDLNAVYHRELSVMSSYSPCLEDLRRAFELIATGAFDAGALSPRSFPLAAFDEAAEAVRSRRALKALLVPA